MKFKTEFQHSMLKGATRMAPLVAFLFVASFFTSCDEDDDKGFQSVAGKWVGDKTELVMKFEGVPTPFNETDDSFAGQAEFKQDGTAVYVEDGEVETGTWSQNNDKLTLTIAEDPTEELDLSGTYTIKELNSSTLKIYIEKETSFEDPDTGIIVNVNIKATLYFNKG